MNNVALLVTFCVVVAYQLWVSILVVRTAIYEPTQKLLQCIGIWLIPIIGAVIVHSILKTEGKPPYKPEKEWTEPGDNAS